MPKISLMLLLVAGLAVSACGRAASGTDAASGDCQVYENLVTIEGTMFVIVNGCGANDSSRPATQADIDRLS